MGKGAGGKKSNVAYAENTEIALEKSMSDIVGLLRKAGAVRISQSEEPERLQIMFEAHERLVRFRVPLMTEYKGPHTHGNGRPVDKKKAVEQRNRQRGRALMLVVKAKLESVESGIELFEEAFFANVVMADGKTVYERAAEPIAIEYATGKVQTAHLMLGGPA